MQNREQLYIGGKWVPSSASALIDVVSASTEEVIGRVPAGSAEDADAAVRAARAAFEAWAATPVERRATLLDKAFQGLVDNAYDIAHTIAGEVGMPIKLCQRIQAGLPAAVMETYARLILEYPFEEQIDNSLVVREPTGVVACITPWNYPLHQVVAKVAPALAAGCTVVLKPSELAPLSAFLLADILEQAGLPPGVFNLVSGLGPVVGEALARNPGVDMISFTGSISTGRRISELAAGNLKRVALELGGKSAALILDDADLAAAVKGTLNACFLNSGQTCSAHSRMLVPKALYREAATLAVEAAGAFTLGDPFGGQARLGPLISEKQRKKVLDYIRRGIEEGAELLCGGPEPPEGLKRGYYVKPTIFGGVDPGSTIAQEEIFGPVLSIITYEDEDEGVAIANGTVYGLAGAVWSGNPERAQRVARRMRAGQIDINGGRFNPLAPFGGFKQSGHGRELGRFGLEEFLETKSLQL